MKSEKQFSALLQVLAGEQQVIQRTDQKAFTLLSVLGVFMVSERRVVFHEKEKVFIVPTIEKRCNWGQ